MARADCRYAVKAIMWNMGVQVEVLNMTASSNVSIISSVDFHNRSDIPHNLKIPCAQACQTKLERTQPLRMQPHRHMHASMSVDKTENHVKALALQ